VSGQTYLPEATGWSFTNQGSAPAAAVSTTRGGINLTLAATSANSIRFYGRTAISPPWTVDAGAFIGENSATSNPEVGLLMLESGTGKFVEFVLQGAGSTANISVIDGTALASGGSSSLFNTNGGYAAGWRWLQFSYDSAGHTVTFRISADGRNWIQLYSVAVTTPFTTAPDTYGLSVNSRNASFNVANWLLYWNERSAAQ
jgi:hypothetical protein